MSRLLLLALLSWLATAAPSRADWLEVLPTCAMGESPRRHGPSELIYPRAGLPAFAQPGDPLTMRVRVPAPLTPPPGVQQERALAGWYFELVGADAISVDGARLHYRLRVADVRPDGHSTLIYRATVELPPWIAPGTYEVRMRSPGTDEVRAAAAVRIGRGPPRLGVLASLPDDPAVLAGLEVDVWLVTGATTAPEPEPDADLAVASDSAFAADADGAFAAHTNAASNTHSVPWLDLRATFAVRVGDALLVAGGCDDVHLPFQVAVRRAGGERMELPRSPAPGQMLVGEEPSPVPTGALTADGDRWVNRSAHPRVVRVVFPERDRGLSLDGASARLGFWPGTPVRPIGQRASVVGLWRVAPNARVRPRDLEPGAPSLEVQIPSEPTTHGPTIIHVRSDGRVALAWEEDGTAFTDQAGRHALPIRFRWLERREVHALAIGPRGAAHRVGSVTLVETERPSGCSTAGAPRAPLWLWVLVPMARRSRRFLCAKRATR